MAQIAVNLINLLLDKKPVNADVIVLDTETTNNQEIGQKIILDIAWMFVNIQQSNTSAILTSGSKGMKNYLVAETLHSQFYKEYFASVQGKKLLDYSKANTVGEMLQDLGININPDTSTSHYGFKFGVAQSQRTEAATMERSRLNLFNDAFKAFNSLNKIDRQKAEYCIYTRYNELYQFRTQKSKRVDPNDPANPNDNVITKIIKLYNDQDPQLIRFTKRSTALIDAYMRNFDLGENQPVINQSDLNLLKRKMILPVRPWRDILAKLVIDITNAQNLYGITGHNIGHDFEAIKQTSIVFGGMDANKIIQTVQSVCMRAIGNFFKNQTPEKIMSLLGRQVGSQVFQQVSVGLKQKGNLTFEVLHDVFIQGSGKYKEAHRAGQDTLDEAKVFLTIVENILQEAGIKNITRKGF